MAKKISKRTREQASHWCALMASSNCELMEQVVNGVGEEAHLFTDVCGEGLLSAPAADLARDAFRASVDDQWRGMTIDDVIAAGIDSRTAWASSEAMLRTGWAP